MPRTTNQGCINDIFIRSVGFGFGIRQTRDTRVTVATKEQVDVKPRQRGFLLFAKLANMTELPSVALRFVLHITQNSDPILFVTKIKIISPSKIKLSPFVEVCNFSLADRQ